jgi:hypothetical protein
MTAVRLSVAPTTRSMLRDQPVREVAHQRSRPGERGAMRGVHALHAHAVVDRGPRPPDVERRRRLVEIGAGLAYAGLLSIGEPGSLPANERALLGRAPAREEAVGEQERDASDLPVERPVRPGSRPSVQPSSSAVVWGRAGHGNEGSGFGTGTTGGGGPTSPSATSARRAACLTAAIAGTSPARTAATSLAAARPAT